MRRRSSILIGVVALVAATAATASATVTSSAGGAAAAADPIKVMYLSGVNTAINNSVFQIAGAQVAVDAINKAGGLKGRPVEMVVCNHQNSAAVAIQCAQQAVDQKIDIVQGANNFQPQSNPILAQANIPQIGATLSNASDYFVKSSFPVTSPSVAWYAGPLIYLKQKLGKKRVAAVSLDASVALDQANFARTVAQRAGMQYAGTVTVPLTITDWTTPVQQLKQLNPDVVIVLASAAQTLAYLRASKLLGLNATPVANVVTINEDVLSQYGADLADGFVSGSPLPPPTGNLPGLKTYRDQVAAAGMTNTQGIMSVSALSGWLNMWALKKLADKMKVPVTKDSLLAAAKTAKNIDLFKILSWSPGQRGPAAFPNDSNGLVYVLTAKGTDYQVSTPTPIDVFKTIGIARKK